MIKMSSGVSMLYFQQNTHLSVMTQPNTLHWSLVLVSGHLVRSENTEQETVGEIILEVISLKHKEYLQKKSNKDSQILDSSSDGREAWI